MHKRLVGVALLSMGLAVASAEVGVRLTDVPQEIRLPLPEGQNAVLTARVDGEVRTLWLACSREAKGRYLLDRVGDGVYQVNLADPVLSAMLEAAGPGEVRVFAEAPDGTLAESIPVRYAVRSTRWEWHRPPRLFVHAGKEVTEVTGWPQGLDPRILALVAEIHGQGMEFTLPGLTGLPLGPGAGEIAAWFEPSEVQLVETRFAARARGISSRASAGEHEWEFSPADTGATDRQLAITRTIRDAWAKEGRLLIVCRQEGMDDMRVALKVTPQALDLPEGEANVVVVQRHTESVPGSGGYLRLYIDDITGGKTLLTLLTAEGRELVKRKSVREGDTVRFALGKNEYELTATKIVNLLVGDDYAEFAVKPHADAEAAP